MIDGKTGHRLVDPPLRDTVGSQASPLTVAMEGPGNDVFLTWMADCAGHEGDDTEFAFVKGGSRRTEWGVGDFLILQLLLLVRLHEAFFS